MLEPAFIVLALLMLGKAYDDFQESRRREAERQERLYQAQLRAALDRQQRERGQRQAAARDAAERADALARRSASIAAEEAKQRDTQAAFGRCADPLSDYLSYARLRAFHECPARFLYKYIEGRVGDESRLPVASGKGFHDWLESVLAPHIGRAFPHAMLRSAPQPHANRAQSLVGRIPEGAQLLGVEYQVQYSLGQQRIKGFVDILYRESNGTLVICDVKTGKSPKIHLEQLELYALLLLPEEPGVRLEYHLVDLNELVWWRIRRESLPKLSGELIALAERIRRERDWDPVPGGHCKTCQYHDECPDAGTSRGKPKDLRLIQLTAAKSGAKHREKEFG
jgi:CRISPR/Cas system-associated exonuclease Cas4 (RecB family)